MVCSDKRIPGFKFDNSLINQIEVSSMFFSFCTVVSMESRTCSMNSNWSNNKISELAIGGES